MLGYRFGPLRLVTTIRLPELGAPRPPRAGAWRVRFSRGAVAERARWTQSWSFPDGRPWARIGIVAAGFVVRFARTAAFRIDVPQRTIVARARDGVPVATVRHLLLDQVLPLVIAQGRHLVIHASAVEVDGEAVAFVGESGSGKSTLAGWCVRAGRALLADDCFVVDVRRQPAEAIPACSGLRLWPDAVAALFASAERGRAIAHYSVKRRLHPVRSPLNGRDRRLPLRALCVLQRGGSCGAPSLTRLRGQEAFAAIIACTFHLELNRAAAARALDRVAALLDRTPAYRLQLPHSLARLKAIPSMVEALVRQ